MGKSKKVGRAKRSFGMAVSELYERSRFCRAVMFSTAGRLVTPLLVRYSSVKDCGKLVTAPMLT